MKKVLSVLLAAAMVMGMSVSAFADHSWKPAGGTDVADPVVNVLDFEGLVVVEREDIGGWNVDYKTFVAGSELNLEPGDNLYFPLLTAGTQIVVDKNNQTCELEEGHTHNAECYTLTCEEHVHTGECEEKCTLEEHYHHPAFGCFNWKGQLTCRKPEHKHGESCVMAWTCGQEDHTHNDDCYTLTCKKEVEHTHGDSCYDTKEVPVMVNYTGDIDPNWSINIKGNVYVDGASYYTAPATGATSWGETGVNGYKYVKVEIADDLDATSTKTVKFELYIADEDYKNCETEHVIVEAKFANVKEAINKVDFNHTNDADEAAVWEVAKGAKGTATFDFDSVAYFTVKMVPEEKVTLNLSTAYSKAIDKLFDYEADLEFYNFKGTKDAFTKVGELFIPADEDTFIYEVVDGELVEVEATWTDEYTITDVTKEYEGWVIETNELGYYVVSDIEAEIEVEAEVEAPVEAEKANPETGAADFVGAAVAMAVVSVAAAGALALKK